jgi:hypothetical protein
MRPICSLKPLVRKKRKKTRWGPGARSPIRGIPTYSPFIWWIGTLEYDLQDDHYQERKEWGSELRVREEEWKACCSLRWSGLSILCELQAMGKGSFGQTDNAGFQHNISQLLSLNIAPLAVQKEKGSIVGCRWSPLAQRACFSFSGAFKTYTNPWEGPTQEIPTQ